jgi:hypothetical protein
VAENDENGQARRMSHAQAPVLCLALSLLACDASDSMRDVHDLGQDRDPSRSGDENASSGAGGASDAGACGEGLRRRATTLLDQHRACTRDEDCRAEPIHAPCPAPHDCSVFVRHDTDLLWSELAELEQGYLACGYKCAAAKCGERPRSEAYCNASKQCAGRSIATEADAAVAWDAASAPDAARRDAGEGSEGGDASARDAGSSDAARAASAAYACNVNLDCVIKDVGNCCGYYPRCANVAATFAPPSCSGGQAGVCGFPSIDRCECRQNECVSLQNGRPL